MKKTDVWPIIRLVALIVQVPGLMAALSVPIAVGAGESAGALAFAATAAFAVGLGLALHFFLPPGHNPDFRETMVACAAGWLASALIGLIPFMIVAYSTQTGEVDAVHVFRDFWNAFFESMSGFTTTGLTVVDRPSQLPVSLQWWRSFSQWVGGAGMIILVLAVLRPGQELTKLARAEGHKRTFGQSMIATVRETWWIYLVFTCFGVVLLRSLGMTTWESINHTMTAVSTGGFTISDHSLRGYSGALQSAVVAVTVLGAISFSWHQHLFKLDWVRCRSDSQTFTLLVVLVVGAVLAASTQIMASSSSDLLTAAMHWVSALTTSGFSTGEIDGWSGPTKLLFILAMIVGGCTGSAAGGIKVARVAILSRELAGFVRTIVFKPWLLVFRPATLTDEVDTELVGRFTAAALLVVLWFCIVALAVYAIALIAGPNVELTDVLFDVCSALSIAGLSTGVADADLNAGGKAIFVLLMWMGRLEILPVLVFLAWLTGCRPTAEDTSNPA